MVIRSGPIRVNPLHGKILGPRPDANACLSSQDALGLKLPEKLPTREWIPATPEIWTVYQPITSLTLKITGEVRHEAMSFPYRRLASDSHLLFQRILSRATRGGRVACAICAQVYYWNFGRATFAVQDPVTSVQI